VTDRKAFSQLRQLHWAAGLSAALGLLVSCSSPGKQEADISASSLIQRVRDEGTAEQRAAVADGVVTFEEYERSALAYISCLESAGFSVDGTLRFRGRYYDIVAQTAGTQTVEMQEAWSDCAQEFALILDVWSVQNQPSEAELQAARRALAECLREHGIEVGDPPSGEELGILAQAGRPGFARCSVEVSETFGLPGFAG
jgi:hypothetical protein